MKMKFLIAPFLWLFAMLASANDGVYYVNGNQIVPLQETDIAVTKEVLTITMGNDDFARVDVQYEFTNRGKAKTIDVGFEAQGPYEPGGDSEFNKAGKHPDIFDFTVEMNGAQLPIRNYVMRGSATDDSPDFTPLDLNQWKLDDEEGEGLRNKNTDEFINYSYAYCFKANFKEGKNVVHHTYRYRMSSGVYQTFNIPYWLLPAMRWANHQIDDFTLRLKVDKTAKQFCMTVDDTWMANQWKLTSGKGKIRTVNSPWGGDSKYVEFALRDGTYEFHANNFRPKENINILSTECLTLSESETFKLGSFYDRGTVLIAPYELQFDDEDGKFFDGTTDGISNKRIIRNLPYAHRGYVFQDAKLKAYFSKIWWYMPDPNWKQDTSDFTKTEWELINNNK